ncbi:hypothetical protein [Paenibacillus tarimensis]|uniref:hypothetical protein n=1 Tax=Paenibacillus tarimensis TaxID=416012 RepID=UPI001F459984|nr:hypothetical protein [Paenibacillus tarimensis]MCF2944887.1 hypothetical protein [Paenibacillus tarimensis]
MDRQPDELLETVSKWFEEHTHRPIRIIKREQGDVDQIRMNVEHIGYRDSHTVDDYTDGLALMLYGYGEIINNRQPAELPQPIFEIPVEGLSAAEVSDHQMILITERAAYSIDSV